MLYAGFTSHRNSVLQDISISTDDMFNDSTVLHEYGHHVQSQFAQLSPGFGHDLCTFDLGNTPTRAFQEAWASAFATETFARTPGGLDVLQSWEAPGLCEQPYGDDVEKYVGGALWDLIDYNGNLEAGDTFTRDDLVGGTPLGRLLVELVDRELDAPDQGIMDFRRALMNRGIDSNRLDELLRHNRVMAPALPGPTTPPPDPVDPVEPPDELPIYCKSKPYLCN
jgi:hypothetical protein